MRKKQEEEEERLKQLALQQEQDDQKKAEVIREDSLEDEETDPLEKEEQKKQQLIKQKQQKPLVGLSATIMDQILIMKNAEQEKKQNQDQNQINQSSESKETGLFNAFIQKNIQSTISAPQIKQSEDPSKSQTGQIQENPAENKISQDTQNKLKQKLGASLNFLKFQVMRNVQQTSKQVEFSDLSQQISIVEEKRQLFREIFNKYDKKKKQGISYYFLPNAFNALNKKLDVTILKNNTMWFVQQLVKQREEIEEKKRQEESKNAIASFLPENKEKVSQQKVQKQVSKPNNQTKSEVQKERQNSFQKQQDFLKQIPFFGNAINQSQEQQESSSSIINSIESQSSEDEDEDEEKKKEKLNPETQKQINYNLQEKHKSILLPFQEYEQIVLNYYAKNNVKILDRYNVIDYYEDKSKDITQSLASYESYDKAKTQFQQTQKVLEDYLVKSKGPTSFTNILKMVLQKLVQRGEQIQKKKEKIIQKEKQFKEKQIKGIKEIFNFYAKTSFEIGQHATFDKYEYEKNTLNFAKFMRFCKDFDFMIKDNNYAGKLALQKRRVMIRQEVNDIFISNCDSRKVLDFQNFLNALSDLSNVFFDED